MSEYLTTPQNYKKKTTCAIPMPFFLRFPSFPRPYQSRTSPVSFPTAHRRHTDGTPTAEGSVDRRSTVGRLSAPLREWYGRDTEARRKRWGTTGAWQVGQYMTYIRHIYVMCMPYARHMHVIYVVSSLKNTLCYCICQDFVVTLHAFCGLATRKEETDVSGKRHGR